MGAFEKVISYYLLKCWDFKGDIELIEMLILSYQDKINRAKKNFAVARDVAAHIASTENVALIQPLDWVPDQVKAMIA